MGPSRKKEDRKKGASTNPPLIVPTRRLRVVCGGVACRVQRCAVCFAPVERAAAVPPRKASDDGRRVALTVFAVLLPRYRRGNNGARAIIASVPEIRGGRRLYMAAFPSREEGEKCACKYGRRRRPSVAGGRPLIGLKVYRNGKTERLLLAAPAAAPPPVVIATGEQYGHRKRRFALRGRSKMNARVQRCHSAARWLAVDVPWPSSAVVRAGGSGHLAPLRWLRAFEKAGTDGACVSGRRLFYLGERFQKHPFLCGKAGN